MTAASLSSLRLSKDLKYTALYYALGFDDPDEGLFIKDYRSAKIIIDSDRQAASLQGLNVKSKNVISLVTHESFVILECLDRLLRMGYDPKEIILFESGEIICGNLRIRCFNWDSELLTDDPSRSKNSGLYLVSYKSRLYSGILEYKNIISFDGGRYEDGIFDRENSSEKILLHDNPKMNGDSDFVIEGSKLIKYKGNAKSVVIPEGVTSLESGLFWDNQDIEEVQMPESLLDFGGDTFYNCRNLRKVNIPANVRQLGNNPFAGCPKLHISCESKHFELKNGVLFSKDGVLIYYPIERTEKTYEIPYKTRIIGKHAFFLCDSLELVTIPSSITHMENNPFSGCSHLKLINRSPRYVIQDDVIYNKNKTQVVGALNSIDTDCLALPETVTTICRNSFWNCRGLRKIVFPKSLRTIGYNPFIGCTNIEFVSHSENYHVIDGVLYSKDLKTLICYPAHLASGPITLKDSVEVLERGAFSGCSKMTSIDLKNVYKINKTCFTNCDGLERIILSDLVTYVGEWAFAHCSNLKLIFLFKETVVDRNAFLNTKAVVDVRKERSNMAFESENMSTLESMSYSLERKVKAILIDPPYNSAIDYIGYQDSGFEGGYVSFLSRRISLSTKLLSDDGFLVINIDEDNLKDVIASCEKYFPESSILKLRWKKKHPYFDKNRVVLNPNKRQTDYEWIIICKKSEKSVFHKIMQPYIDNGVLKEKMSDVPEVFDCFGTTSSAKDEIADLFGDRKAFSTPKPVKLIKELVRATTDKNSIVIDFFAGSGTLGQAVYELNNEDMGKRTFILISNNEGGFFRNILARRLHILKIPSLIF